MDQAISIGYPNSRGELLSLILDVTAVEAGIDPSNRAFPYKILPAPCSSVAEISRVSLLLQKRIAFPLFANRRERAVSGND